MQFNTKEFTLNGKPRVISEVSVGAANFIFPNLDEWAKKEANGDEVLEFFANTYYASLASCTQPMPSLQEAYNLNGSLDGWYDVVREVNPELFDSTEFTEEEVTLSDGKKFSVQSIRPSTLMRRVKLEKEAKQETERRLKQQADDALLAKKEGKEYSPPLPSVSSENYRLVYYPLLAGCSVGDVPKFEDALMLSADDKQIWYNAARRQVPNWFLTNEQIALRNLEASKETDKKKSKPAKKS